MRLTHLHFKKKFLNTISFPPTLKILNTAGKGSQWIKFSISVVTEIKAPKKNVSILKVFPNWRPFCDRAKG